MWWELGREFIQDLRAHRTRAVLTIVAITWGTVAVVLLLSFGEGLGTQMRNGLMNAGNQIMILYAGETGMAYEGIPKGRRIHLDEEDAQLLQRALPTMIAMISPQYRSSVRLTFGMNTANTECEGVNPAFEEMRRMFPMAGGRFVTDRDVQEQRRVVVLGDEIAGTVLGPVEPVGKTILLDGIPFLVVGILQPKIQTSMSNGPDRQRAIIPYSTMRTIYGQPHVNSLVVRPAQPGQQDDLKKEIFRVLARKHHFHPADERTLFIWDFIEAEKIGRRVGLGVTIFLFTVGFMTLMIAGVGVANVMYVVVRERTREIGVKMAVGARRSVIRAQFVFEAVLLAFIGGTLGLLISTAVIAIVRLIPSDDGPMQYLGRPVLSLTTMVVTTGILALIGLLAGYFPARRAASVDPVESLRYE